MARLLSVNVGLPRDVVWQGRTVHTAIWKALVHGPADGAAAQHRRRRARRSGGARRRTPGGLRLSDGLLSLLAEPTRPKRLHTCGQFGEEFTVDGLPDDAVCISCGNRIQTGRA